MNDQLREFYESCMKEAVNVPLGKTPWPECYFTDEDWEPPVVADWPYLEYEP